MKYLPIALLVFMISCNSEKPVAPATFYHSDLKTQVKAKGFMQGDKETQAWTYIDKQGQVVAEGEFKAGLLTDSWKYNYPGFKKDVTWQIATDETGKLNISVPTGFVVEKVKDLLMLAAYDTVKEDRFALFLNDYKDSTDMTGKLNGLKAELENTFVIKASQVKKMVAGKTAYYYSNFSVLDTSESKSYLIQSYIGTVGNKLADMSYKSAMEDSTASRVIFSEIFQHAWYNDERLNDPYAETAQQP